MRSDPLRSRGAWWLLLTCSLAAACSDHQADVPALAADAATDGGTLPGVWLDEPLTPFPENLAQVGLFAPDTVQVNYARAVAYEPAHPLWSNETAKQRFLVLPAEGSVTVDAAGVEGASWQFPPGTVFFKTFFDPDEPNRPLETRLLRRSRKGWDYAAYLWEPAASLEQARLLALAEPQPVRAHFDGKEFEHLVPSETQCRTCHEAGANVVLGFSELQLGADASQWAALRRSVLRGAPEEPQRIAAEDVLTQRVLGYVHGNCVHCHNESSRSPAVDLSYRNFAAATVGVATTGRQVPKGLRVDPGRPETSLLYAMLVGSIEPVMPSLGVQIQNPSAADLVRRWILALPAASRPR